MSKRPRIPLVNVCAAFPHHASSSEGRRLVNFVKLLTVPAVLLLSGLMAVPAFGQTPSATISNLLASCKGNKVCFGFDVVTTDFGASGQDIAVDLINANTNTVQETLTEHLTADTTHVADCFKTSVPAKFTVKIRVPAGGNLNLSGTLTTDILSCGTPTTTTTTTTLP